MDGASKFVRGDAIAALLITFINVIGGIIIGVAQQSMGFGEAARTYTLLTCGDGLVSQVPALIVSTAAGLLVSKAGVRGAADKAMGKQLSNYPKALGMSAAVMGGIALLPGIPMLPFLSLAAGAAWLARKIDQQNKARLAAGIANDGTPLEAGAPGAPREEPIADVLKIDDLKIEIGYALLPLVNSPDGSDRLTEQIKALRRQLAGEAGFVMPSVRILDNVQLDANQYVIRVKEIEAGAGSVFPNLHMAMDPMGGQVQLPGHHLLEPTFGLPATWVDEGLRDEASLRGYTVVDAATVMSTHLAEVIKGHMAELLSHVEVQKLLKELPKEHGELIKEIVPANISTTGIQRVLQLLLTERVSIRDLGTIIEGISEVCATMKNPRDIAEHVRARLARQLCAQYTAPGGHVPIITLSPQWEQAFLESIVGHGDDRHLAMQPSKLTEFVHLVRDRYEDAARLGEMPVLVTSVGARPFVRSIIERFRRETPVLSQGEIHPRVRLKTVGSV
jgi:flagellar biosynthesis protein FlhA